MQISRLTPLRVQISVKEEFPITKTTLIGIIRSTGPTGTLIISKNNASLTKEQTTPSPLLKEPIRLGNVVFDNLVVKSENWF